ncbi:unnamed protein product, partial [Mesorhabditis belari]|uniref:Uncharacterized protein n=1 Tax=Mesorhabditis belari TaxID=2138241 RepID=A0AAF3EWY4_9BILA
MGISNGWELASGYTMPVSIATLQGASIAIDLPLVMKQLESGSVSLVNGVLRRTLHLMSNGIRPVMVFEGANVSHEKKRTQLERQVAATTSPTLPRETQIKLKKAAKELVSSQKSAANTSKSSDGDVILLDSWSDDDNASTSFCEFVTSWTGDEEASQDTEDYIPKAKRFRTNKDTSVVGCESDEEGRRKEECHAGLTSFLLGRMAKSSPEKAVIILGSPKKNPEISVNKSPVKASSHWHWQSKSRAIEDVMSTLNARSAITTNKRPAKDESSEDEWEEVEVIENSRDDKEANDVEWIPNHPEALLERPDRPMAQAGQRITGQYTDIKTLLSLLGVPFVDSPGEAEQQCVQLVKDNLVYTEDSDVLALGAAPVVRHLFAANPELVDLPSLKELGVVPGIARAAALLAGCDYREGLPSFGISNAIRLLSSFVPDMKDVNKDSIDSLFCERAVKWVNEIEQEENADIASRSQGRIRARFFKAITETGKDVLSPISAYSNAKADSSTSAAVWAPMKTDQLAAFLSAKLSRPIHSMKAELLPVSRKWAHFTKEGFPNFSLPTISYSLPKRDDVRKLYEILHNNNIYVT